MGGSKAPTVLHFLSFLFHHRSMTTVTKQVQHDPHWTESLFLTGGNGEELNRASRPKVSSYNTFVM